MPELQNKNTDAFMQAINKYAQEQRNKIQIEAEKFKKEELEKAEKEAMEDSYRMIQRELCDMGKKITGQISQKNLEAKKELFLARNKIMNDVFSKSEDSLIRYTSTPEYKKLLKKQAEDITKLFGKAVVQVYLKADDLKYKDELSDILGEKYKIVSDKTIKIGGLKAINKKKGLIVDATLDSRLEGQREWFEENSGLKVV